MRDPLAVFTRDPIEPTRLARLIVEGFGGYAIKDAPEAGNAWHGAIVDGERQVFVSLADDPSREFHPDEDPAARGVVEIIGGAPGGQVMLDVRPGGPSEALALDVARALADEHELAVIDARDRVLSGSELRRGHQPAAYVAGG